MHLVTGAGTTEHTYEEQEEAAGAHTRTERMDACLRAAICCCGAQRG